MEDSSPNYPDIPSLKTELMSPTMGSVSDINAFSQMSLYSQSSPSFPQQFYNWGMYPYMYHPGYQPFMQQPPVCMQNQMIPTDPFPSFNSIPNENIPPTCELEDSFEVPIVQKKRTSAKDNSKTRVVFTTEQKYALNTLFAHMNNLMKMEREELGEAIGLTQNQIKIWLQNRRYKDKKRLPEVLDQLKSKLDYDEVKAKNAVRLAIEEYKKHMSMSTNCSYYTY